MPPIDPSILLLSLLVVAVAAMVQGGIGMGFGQIAAAGLIWTVPEMLPGLVIAMALVVGGIGAHGEWRAIDPAVLSIALVGRIAGTLLALPLLLRVSDDRDEFALLFGGLILVAVALSLVRIRLPFTKSSLLAGGGASGLMGTITAVGAPPMGLVFQDQPAASARPTLNAFFAIGAAVSLGVLIYADLFDLAQLLHAVYLLPGLIVGMLLSRHLHRHVDRRFRIVILLFTALSASVLIGRTLLQG